MSRPWPIWLRQRNELDYDSRVTNTNDGDTDVLDDSVLAAANVLMGVAARSVIDVEASVSSPQLRVLVFLTLRGPQAPGAVARELNVHASNATRICDRLVRMGYLKRVLDEEDRRSVRLELTANAVELVAKVFEHRRVALARVVRSIPASQRVAVLDAFRVFAEAADEVGSSDGRFALIGP